MNQEMSALYNQEVHPSVSRSYQLMPTIEIVKKCESNGYNISSYQQVKPRNKYEAPFVKHVVRLRQGNTPPVVGEVVPEVVIINSHNRTSPLEFMVGFFRFICANGLVTGDVFANLSKVYHRTNNPFEEVLTAVDHVHEVAVSRLKTIRDMQATNLSDDLTQDFLTKATTLMPERVFQNVQQLNSISRVSDSGNSLWLTYNRVQENLMRGHVHILGTMNHVRKAKPIKAITKTLDLNQRLWNLAESFLPSDNSKTYQLAA